MAHLRGSSIATWQVPPEGSESIISAELINLASNVVTGVKDRVFWAMAVKRDRMLWIPATSVGAFMVVLLAPGLLSFMCPAGLNARVNAVLSYRPFKPGQRRWLDAPTTDLIPAMRDMQVQDFLISALWLAAVLLMMLSPAGDKLGRICTVAWGTLLLPITKHSIWAVVLDSSFERYLKFHRWSARATFVLTLAHLIHQWKLRGLIAFVRITPSTTMFGWVYGTVSFAIMGAICILSVEPIRRHHFELFYYSHFLALPAVAFAMMHSYAVCYAMIPSLALYLIDRAIQLWSSARTFQIQAVTPVAGGAQLVLRRKGAKLPTAHGQYYFLTLPAISRLQKHPLSVALLSSEADILTFFIRDMGPGSFSRQVCQTTFLESATASLIGPYGSLSLPRPLHSYRTIYLIAGGVGVTPMVTVAQSLMQLAPPRPKAHFLWVSRDSASFFEWFPAVLLEMLRFEGFEVLLYHTAASATSASTAVPTAGPTAAATTKTATATTGAVVTAPALTSFDAVAPQAVVVDMKGVMDSGPKEDSSTSSTISPSAASPAHEAALGKARPFELATAVISGRPDLTAVFTPNATEGSNVAVLACGPASLVEDAQHIAHTFRFHFHKETFLF